MATVDFDTTPYEFSHGHTPRGRGSWAFSTSRNADALDPAVIWTPSMTYGEAKRYARDVAKKQGHDLLYVMP